MSLIQALYNRQITGKSLSKFMTIESLLSCYNNTCDGNFLDEALKSKNISVEIDICYEKPMDDYSERNEMDTSMNMETVTDTVELVFDGNDFTSNYKMEPLQSYLNICLFVKFKQEKSKLNRVHIANYDFARAIGPTHDLYEIVESTDYSADIEYKVVTRVLKWIPTKNEIDAIFNPVNLWRGSFNIYIACTVLLCGIGVLAFFIKY